MLEILSIPLNFTPAYFKTFWHVITEPTDVANKINNRQSLILTHRTYFITGICIISSIWGLNAIAYRATFYQLQIYIIVILYFFASIEAFSLLLWLTRYRHNPRSYTRRAFMYVSGTFTVLSLLLVEAFRFFILLPVMFNDTPQCSPRYFECLLQHYAVIDYSRVQIIESWMIGIPGLIGIIPDSPDGSRRHHPNA